MRVDFRDVGVEVDVQPAHLRVRYLLERGRVLYLDKVPGKRRINISSRVGELQPVPSTGLGKALIAAVASS